MKRISFTAIGMLALASLIFLGIMAVPARSVKASGSVTINETNFPDEYFREWISNQTYGGDGVLTEEEIAGVKSILITTANGLKISDFKGIEFFTELTQLSVNSKCSSIDVSHNTKLKKIRLSSGNLTSLDVSHNTSLTELDVSSCKLESLDVRNNPDLKYLFCYHNQLTAINVTKNTKLINFQCYGNKISKLDLTKNTALQTLAVSDNLLTSLDLSKNTELVHLRCDGNPLTALDLSYNTKLGLLQCGENSFTVLDLSKNTALNTLKINDLQISELNLHNKPELRSITLEKVPLKTIDLSEASVLDFLTCTECQLTSLDVSNNPKLTTLQCGANLLQKLDVANCCDLKTLSCFDNDIESLDLSKCPELKSVNCRGNRLTDLDLTGHEKITHLYCSGNGLTELKLNRICPLEVLDCNNNQLADLDVSLYSTLTSLWCKSNPFTRFFIPYKELDRLYYDQDTECIKLGPSDWKYTGTEWNINMEDPGKSLAVAKFECTKAGCEDYKVEEPMEIIFRDIAVSCENEGKKEYTASLLSAISRTGKEITDTKAIKTTDATGHSWGEWQVTKKATVASEGEETRICKNDPSHKQTRKIARLTPTPTAKPTAKPANNAILTLNKKSLTIVCGKTDSLKATLKGATGKITWKSSDKKIATVDSNGKITAKQAGQVTITATAAGKSAKCVVTVLYKDVTNSKDFWYAPTNYLTAKGVVKGYDKQTKFKPANDCTRAQMVTFLYRLQGEPKVKSTTCKFSDVKKTDYFFKPVIWAVEKGITTGVSKTKFDPQGVCTRAQTVTFLWRMAQKPAPKAKTCKFKDVKEKDYFYKPVIWASEKKIVAGYADGTFKPQGKCLRRQMVTFLYKYDKFVNGKG